MEVVYRTIIENFDDSEDYLFNLGFTWKHSSNKNKLSDSTKKYISKTCKKYIFFSVNNNCMLWDDHNNSSFIDIDRIFKIKKLLK